MYKQLLKKQFVVEMFALNFHLGKTESAEAEASWGGPFLPRKVKLGRFLHFP